jgi:hypothetical protein
MQMNLIYVFQGLNLLDNNVTSRWNVVKRAHIFSLSLNIFRYHPISDISGYVPTTGLVPILLRSHTRQDHYSSAPVHTARIPT